MSIEAVIAEHPDVGAGYNATLGLAVKRAVDCAAICNSCADACSAEDMDMAQCIRTCMDCADVCSTTSRVAMRRTGENRSVIMAQLGACILACEICAEECERHEHGHCRRCAQMCREGAEDCRAALHGLKLESEV